MKCKAGFGVATPISMTGDNEVIFHITYRKSLFVWRYDFIFDADKQGDAVLLFAVATGKGY